MGGRRSCICAECRWLAPDSFALEDSAGNRKDLSAALRNRKAASVLHPTLSSRPKHSKMKRLGLEGYVLQWLLRSLGFEGYGLQPVHKCPDFNAALAAEGMLAGANGLLQHSLQPWSRCTQPCY